MYILYMSSLPDGRAANHPFFCRHLQPADWSVVAGRMGEDALYLLPGQNGRCNPVRRELFQDTFLLAAVLPLYVPVHENCFHFVRIISSR
jgi:hypothetical protein